MLNKKLGISMIETLLTISIASILSITLVKYEINNTKENTEKSFSLDMMDLIYGIDKRTSIDGYSYNSWTTKQWDNYTFNDLIQKQLQGVNSSCGKGEWIPLNNKKSLKLVNCNLMNKMVYPLNIKIKIKSDTEGFVSGTTIDYNFKTNKDFDKLFSSFNNAFLYEKTKIKSLKSGTAFFSYIEESTNKTISLLKCKNLKKKCLFRSEIYKPATGEYLKIDGSNSIIKENIKFKTAKNKDPLKCINWTKNNNGDWTKRLDANCGIGFYKTTPITITTNTKEGVFKSIKLDKLCNVYDFSNLKIAPRLKKEPCGITKDGLELIQLIPNINATKGYFNKIDSNEAFLKNLEIDDIISKKINAEYFSLNKTFYSEITTFANEKTNINNKLLTVNANNTFLNKQIVTKGLFVGTALNSLTMMGNTELNNTTITNLVNNNIEVYNSVKLNKISNKNSKCNNGEISRTKDGLILTCIKNNFRFQSGMPIGTIVMWTNKILPKNWIEMNGQSTLRYPKLRAIVGSNVPDIRGVFVRGWNHHRYLKSKELDSDQAFSVDFVSIDRGYGWKDNNGIIKTTSRWDTNMGGGGDDQWGTIVSLDNARQIRTSIESRPKNIALIYIIKAM